jgi:hypothetical protein
MSYFDKQYEKYTVEQLEAFERDVAKAMSDAREEQEILAAQYVNLSNQLKAVRNARAKKVVDKINAQIKTSNAKDQADFSALLASFGGR